MIIGNLKSTAPTCVAKDIGMQDVMTMKKIQGVIGDKALYQSLLGKMMVNN
ncbi:MAG: hypothetical protein ACJAR6_000262 [Oleispira sp.]|jgi:hypothetical protein